MFRLENLKHCSASNYTVIFGSLCTETSVCVASICSGLKVQRRARSSTGLMTSLSTGALTRDPTLLAQSWGGLRCTHLEARATVID